MNTANWPSANPFEVDYVVLFGDANNGGDVDLVDLSRINAFVLPVGDTPDDSRFDINTIGGIGFTDLSASYAFAGSTAPAKPDGHGCFPDACCIAPTAGHGFAQR